MRIDASGFTSHTFDVRVDAAETVTHRVALERAVLPSSPPATATTPARDAGAPHVLYVIPRCYAGDRPPEPTTHCDRTQLRTIR